MADLTTRYLGISLKNPVMAGASGLTSNMDTLKDLEQSGAGAVVISSLFEEQIQLERFKMEEDLAKFDNRYAEMADVFPDVKYAGPDEHLMWVRKAKEALSIPVFASLNAVNRRTWVDYAKRLEETGADGLELNFYATPRSFEAAGADIEKDQIETLREVKKAIGIPISVKLSPFYSNTLHFIKQLDEVGVDGFVLFNRLFQPDIDAREEKNTLAFNFSRKQDSRLPLRFTGLLSERIKADICSSTGIMSADGVIKMILAGAACVQVVSALYLNKVDHLGKMVGGLKKWMEEKNYGSLEDFRGKMSAENNKDPWVYKRSQYVRMLLEPEKLIKNVNIP